MTERVVSGAVVRIRSEELGSYTVNQLKLQTELPAHDGLEAPVFTFGPLEVSADINIQKREFGVTVSILGISFGSFYGSFDNGVELGVDLFLAKGSVRFYIRGSELRVRTDVNFTFGGGFHEDDLIISF